jgi:flagellar M-ring protein FliF
LDRFLAALQRFGIGRLAVLVGVGIGIAAALVALTSFLGAEPKALLYSSLDLKEASSITAALDQAGIKYEAQGDGSTIMVPRDKVASTRLMLSAKGLPTAASIGYEIFDGNNVLGQTDFVQQLNRQRAVEGELARTIRTMKGITDTRVHLVMPKRQLFENEAEQPSASVTIGMAGRQPDPEMVRAIQNLIAGAVPNLKPDRVTVIDENGKTLSAADDGSIAGSMADARRSQVEARLRETVKGLVEGVVGPGKVKVDVSADLDLSRVTVQEEKYDPDGQVVRSESTSERNARDSGNNNNGQVTAAQNVPGGTPADPNFQPLGSQEGANESVTNYEISKSTRTEVREPGEIKKVSVAVAVDGLTAPGTDGKPGAYTPRTAQEMQRIEQLVRAAVGYNQQRGDVVTVVNVKFPSEADQGGVTASNPLMGFDKNDIMRGAEMLVLAIVALLIMLFGVRPLLKAATGEAGAGGLLAGGNPLLAGAAGGAGALGAPEGLTGMLTGPGSVALPPGELEQKIDIARIEGQVKASSIKRVAEFVDGHPEESVSILRNWLHESA